MPQTDEYAAREQARAAAYKAAFETREAREWLAAIPAPLRARAEKLGLLAPALPPPSAFVLEYKEANGASNWRGNQFDENDFAAAALDAGREIDEPETQETFDENNHDYENDTDDE